MTTFFEPINVSATHIYHSTLELSPLSSIVRRLYHHQRPVLLPQVVAGTPASWNQSINIPGSREAPYQFPTWSPCGQLIAASRQGTVEIRDPFSSELISILQPTKPTSKLRGKLAYSPDGCSLAILSGESLIIWDTQTGGVVKEFRCVPIADAHLVWSLDGQTIGTIFSTVSYSGHHMYMHNVSLGTGKSPDIPYSRGLPHLWAHDKSFWVMTIRTGDMAQTIEIFEAGSVLTEINSFQIKALGCHVEVKSFSPATYQISILDYNQILVINVLNSQCLLKQEFEYNSCECFSPDGNFFAVSWKAGIHVWRYSSGRYTSWRSFTLQDLNLDLIQFSPTLSAIVGSSRRGLRVWRLDQPPIDACPNRDPPLVALSHHGVYAATAHRQDSTITITNFLSQSPPQTIDTGMRITCVALTGNVLLVEGHAMDRAWHVMVMAWWLTEEGAVNGASGNRGVDIGNSIWTVTGSFPINPKLSIQGKTVVMKWGLNIIHTYHAGTGKLLEPSQTPLSSDCKWYDLQDMMYGQHYPHYHELEYGYLSKNAWSVSKTALQQGWMKDPEGRHRIWIPTECRVDFSNVCWLQNITTLRLNINLRDTGGTMIIMF